MTRSMRYCQRCVLPDTRPHLRLDSEGVCNACRQHKEKLQLDWRSRERGFLELVEEVRNNRQGRAGYDCVLPVSGGKDSTWQVVKCLEVGLKPLAVTWRTPGRTKIGQANLDNLRSLGVDHIDFSISPRVEARFMVESLRREGTPAIPMHFALFHIPLTVAVRYRIPLVIYGENSADEYGSLDGSGRGHALNREWIRRYGVTHGTDVEDWISEGLSAEDLTPYFGPSDAELEAAGVRALFLGSYFSWDPSTTLAVAKQAGFQERVEGPKVGSWCFADIDCDFISIHHAIKWLKFGFTRSFDNLSLEIRNGEKTRDQALEILRQERDPWPREDLAKFREFTGTTEAELREILETLRNPEIWIREDGQFRLDGFLFPDFDWSVAEL